MRVVSLLPAATEILFSLGVEPAAVSHACDHPPAARDRPTVVRSRVDDSASSAGITEQVAAAERSGGIYELDRDLLAELAPDLAVTQGICDTCAVDTVQVREAVSTLDLECAVLTTDPHRLEDLFANVERIGSAVDVPDRARILVENLRDRVEGVAGAAPTDGPRVAVLDWLDPVMVAGHWVPDLVETAGGRYALADPGTRSRPRDWREIRAYDPEVLVLGPCGLGLERTMAEASLLANRPGYDDLAAVRAGRVYAMDGNHYLNRPGPRLVDTLKFLAGVLHPDTFEAPPTDAVRPVAPARA